MSKNNYSANLITLTLYMNIVESKNDPHIAKWVYDNLKISFPEYTHSPLILGTLLKIYTRGNRYEWIHELLNTYHNQYRDSISLIFLLYVHINTQNIIPITNQL